MITNIPAVETFSESRGFNPYGRGIFYPLVCHCPRIYDHNRPHRAHIKAMITGWEDIEEGVEIEDWEKASHGRFSENIFQRSRDDAR
jgi:hypothetical protein